MPSTNILQLQIRVGGGWKLPDSDNARGGQQRVAAPGDDYDGDSIVDGDDDSDDDDDGSDDDDDAPGGRQVRCCGLLPNVSAAEVGDCEDDEELRLETCHGRRGGRGQRRRHDSGAIDGILITL